MTAAHPPGFNSIFNRTPLAGGHPLGTAEWRVEDSSIIGSVRNYHRAGGWLLLEHAYEDFILEFSLRCTNCESGVLLRDAPLSWSRFSHAPNAGGRTSGVYLSLSGGDASAISVIVLDAQGRIVDRKPVANQATEHGPDTSDTLKAGACPPIPCEGINDPQAGPLRWPPESPLQITQMPDGWKRVRITMRGGAVTSDERSRYGQVALHVSGPAGAEVRFKDISLLDLTCRVAVPSNGVPDVVAGPLYYLGPDYKIAHEIYPPETINPSGIEEHGNYTNCFLTYVHDLNGDGWPDVLMIMGFGPSPDFSGHISINPQRESRHCDNYDVLPSITAETDSWSISTEIVAPSC